MVDLSLTIIIQCINFGILLWLLKKVLFGPVTRLLEKRASDIKRLRDDSEGDRKKAAAYLTEADENLTKARKDALDTVASSRMEGFREREKIVARAKDDAETIMQKARSEMELEAERARNDLRQSTVRLSIQIAEKVIRRELKSEDQEKMAQRFLDEIEKTP